MADKVLVDTNVLLYAYDRGESVKQPQAVAVLDRLATKRVGVLTAQVLAEFFFNATHKLKTPMTLEQAYGRVENYLLAWEVLDVTGAMILEAVRGVRDHQLAYWDAQIWATARLNQIPFVLSEDFSAGMVLEGVRFVNPFADDFDVDAWLPSQP
jgi:predicted nucleic acid-binding protein